MAIPSPLIAVEWWRVGRVVTGGWSGNGWVEWQQVDGVALGGWVGRAVASG